MFLSKKILYQYFYSFFALLGTASPLKTVYMPVHDTKTLTLKRLRGQFDLPVFVEICVFQRKGEVLFFCDF